MFDNRSSVHDGVTFDWNGEHIRFSDWEDDEYGEFSYLTRDGQFEFTFDLQPVPDSKEVRIYILDQPRYEGRDNDGESTHRLKEHAGAHAGRLYVCVDDKDPPTNVPDALSWLVYWAEKTAEYINTGTKFS
jgi:hypothetical protein